jgi:predicted transcriptional regulator
MKRRSKLQIQINILTVLNQRGPSKITHIMYESNTNCGILKKNLTFLTKQELVEKKTTGKDRIAYRITPKGTSMLSTFKEFKQMLLVEETPNLIPLII